MINRELTTREREIFLMIKRTTFWDVVGVVREEVSNYRYNARKELKHLKNADIKDVEDIVPVIIPLGRQHICEIQMRQDILSVPQ